uniref:Uncharacterized protein n=1 Tax=candidate division WOR-3 bacterium TaxID=2052148 RepID=A0A7C4TAL7_UNCW3
MFIYFYLPILLLLIFFSLINQATTVGGFCLINLQFVSFVVARFIGRKTAPIVVAQFIGHKTIPL